MRISDVQTLFLLDFKGLDFNKMNDGVDFTSNTYFQISRAGDQNFQVNLVPYILGGPGT